MDRDGVGPWWCWAAKIFGPHLRLAQPTRNLRSHPDHRLNPKPVGRANRPDVRQSMYAPLALIVGYKGRGGILDGPRWCWAAMVLGRKDFWAAPSFGATYAQPPQPP